MGPARGGRLASALLLGLAATLLLPGLGGYPLLDPSEARPAAIAREMSRHDRWLVPILHGERYSDKPAPFYWLLRATAALPVSPEAAARLPSAIATAATALVLHAFARRRLGARAALLGCIVYLTTPVVIALGRFATQDALLSGFTTAATIAWLCWIDRPVGAPAAAYALMGVGALVKGPIAIVLPLVVAAVAAWDRRLLRARMRRARLGTGLAAASSLMLAWFIPSLVADPSYGWGLVVDHHLRRFLTGDVGHPEPAWFLLPALFGMLLPWSLVLPACLAAEVREDPWGSTDPRAGDGRDAVHARQARGPHETPRPGNPPGAARTARDLWLWALCVAAFFSLSRAKLATYLLPALPPLALWLGWQLAALADAEASAGRAPGLEPERTSRARWSLRLARGALALWAAILGAAPLAAWIYLRREAPSLAAWALLCLPLPALAALGLRHAWAEPRRLAGLPFVFAASTSVVALIAYLAAAPVVARIASDAVLAHTASTLAPGVPIVGFRIQSSSLAFYAEGTVRKLRDPRDVLRIAAGGPLLIVAREKGAEALRREGLELHPWTECLRHCLWGTVPKNR